MTALRDFVADLMEREGAAVEILEPDGLEVIAPPEIRAAFGWPELARLGLPAAASSGLSAPPRSLPISARPMRNFSPT